MAVRHPVVATVPAGRLVAANSMVADRDRLSDRIGYRFQSAALLECALTHSSSLAAPSSEAISNQRLEFLGDRVLGLVVAEMLFQSFADSTEGELAPRLNALVRSETCAAVAREIDLGRFLIMGRGEADAGGRGKTAILADACEAVIAALYLDGGLAAARAFVRRYWLPRLEMVRETPRDAKTLLQEWLQAQGLAPPRYVLVERSGPDHQPVFKVAAKAAGIEAAVATAGSKRAAEQAAAEAMLRREGVL